MAQAFPDNKANPEYRSFMSTTRHILATEGPGTFLAGLGPRAFRVCCAGGWCQRAGKGASFSRLLVPGSASAGPAGRTPPCASGICGSGIVPEMLMLRFLPCGIAPPRAMPSALQLAPAVFILNGVRNTVVDALQAQRTPHVVPV